MANLPRRVTYHEPASSDKQERDELRGYIGRLLGRVPKCRVVDCEGNDHKLGVRYKDGREIRCTRFFGYEVVRDELQRLVELAEGKDGS